MKRGTETSFSTLAGTAAKKAARTRKYGTNTTSTGAFKRWNHLIFVFSPNRESIPFDSLSLRAVASDSSFFFCSSVTSVIRSSSVRILLAFAKMHAQTEMNRIETKPMKVPFRSIRQGESIPVRNSITMEVPMDAEEKSSIVPFILLFPSITITTTIATSNVRKVSSHVSGSKSSGTIFTASAQICSKEGFLKSIKENPSKVKSRFKKCIVASSAKVNNKPRGASQKILLKSNKSSSFSTLFGS